MQDFRQLKVWQKAHALTLKLYEETKNFPSDERFGLTSQIRQGSSSIGANIAEGCGVNSRVHFARYLQLASGSTSELAYHLILAKDLGYIEQEQFLTFAAKTDEVHKMLAAFIAKLKSASKAAGAGS
jgi:four helix bundle protein